MKAHNDAIQQLKKANERLHYISGTVKELELKLCREKLEQQEILAEAIIQAERRERANLGHELHDNVNQVLTTARLYLDMIKPTDEHNTGILDKTREFIADAINEIRNISKEMVLPALKKELLSDSICELLDDIKATGLYNISFAHEDVSKADMPEGKRIALFRIMQEQLKNIIKHSHARNIQVSLCITASQAELVIKDDGAGFDLAKKRKGIGLSNIYDRVKLYKGSVDLTTAPGKGCQLVVRLPLEDSMCS